MYPVSEAFLQAVQENTRRYYWTGKITTKAGVVHEFSEKDIVKGSGYVSSQCCGSTEMELGTVYSAEMGITLLSEIDRYTLEDALIEPFYHLLVGDAYETVPMGIFEISEANRSIRCLEIKAYDYMLRFEKDFNVTETIGNAYEIVALCCKACSVELAHTQREMEAMQNGSTVLSIYSENDIETYRDVLYYIGQVLGGFFCINREGKLELRKYGSEPVMNINNKQRFSSSFSDFITRYTAVSSTNMKTQTAEYYALETDDGLTMNLGVNPFLQFGTDDTRKELCEQILADISVIKYVPFDSDTIGNPALDIGDVLKFSGGHADEEQITCITYSQCRIGGKHSLKCVGKNPRLAQAKSKNDKNISGLLNQVDAGKIGIHTFTNASAYTLGETDTRIISIEFATTEENHAQFFGQVVVDAVALRTERTESAKGTISIPLTEKNAETGETIESPLEVEVELPVTWSEDGKVLCYVTFELNDAVVTVHCPVETWHSGKHILSLYYPIESIVPNITNTFNVYLRMENGTGTVGIGDCIASISGQAMGAAVAWDGKIEIEEKIGRFVIGGGMNAKGITDTVATQIIEYVQRSYTDQVQGRSAIGAFCRPVTVE
ncbi:MAG: hypothetical protein J6B94_06840 [Lachnospiraceae bacterium]|nr:hypothetical protein [Lachnospiraceae bacterium]